MANTTSLNQFLKNEKSLTLLARLRAGGALCDAGLDGISLDDRAYLRAEHCIRLATYSKLEEGLPEGISPWVRTLSIAYRDLFTNPEKAIEVLDELQSLCPEHLDLPLRLKFWRAHLNLILGRIGQGIESLNSVTKNGIPESFWKIEMLCIRALGCYFTGKTRESLVAHKECQDAIDQNPDLFCQTFNSGMAARAALKLCDPDSFEFFTKKLEESLSSRDDSRYRLRHTGYRALILNQLGEHEGAAKHWKKGDRQLSATESALERGQYLVFRGLSHCLQNDQQEAEKIFTLAAQDLAIAGSPPIYIAELEIAQTLTPLVCPHYRGTNLKKTVNIATLAADFLRGRAGDCISPMSEMYGEAADFCIGLLDGLDLKYPRSDRQSLVLSVIENVTHSHTFAKGLSHFHLIPNFVDAIGSADLTEDGIGSALKSVLKIRPIFENEKFSLPNRISHLGDDPEIRTILDFSGTLLELGKKSDRLFSTEARLKEATRATHLLHDLRFFAAELSRLANGKDQSLDLSKFAGHLEKLIEGYLRSLKSGQNPSLPVIVSVPRLLQRVAAMAEQITGKKPFMVQGDTLPLVWASETLLNRLLLNLIKNGIEAGTGNNPVSVTYNVSVLPSGESIISILVSDNGSGIDPEVLARARSKDTEISGTTTKTNGIGLGLKSALDCADAIGAKVSILPNSGSGTTFRIDLNIAAPKAMRKFGAPEPEIIVIDDSSAVLDAWQAFGETEDQSVLTLLPEEACPILNQIPKSTQWVVLDYDLKLPGFNGADLATIVSKLGVKIALSSGYQPEELPDDAKRIPWSATLSKEPQSPDKAKKFNPILLKSNVPASSEILQSELRHDIKNELTPIKQVFRIMKERQLKSGQQDPYLSLFERGLEGLERVVKKPAPQNKLPGERL